MRTKRGYILMLVCVVLLFAHTLIIRREKLVEANDQLVNEVVGERVVDFSTKSKRAALSPADSFRSENRSTINELMECRMMPGKITVRMRRRSVQRLPSDGPLCLNV